VGTPGLDYTELPWSEGANLTVNPNQDPIAGFFASGKFLYTGSTFGETLTVSLPRGAAQSMVEFI